MPNHCAIFYDNIAPMRFSTAALAADFGNIRRAKIVLVIDDGRQELGASHRLRETTVHRQQAKIENGIVAVTA